MSRTSGPPEYGQIVRVHQNTLEHLAVFLPNLWLFAVTAMSPLFPQQQELKVDNSESTSYVVESPKAQSVEEWTPEFCPRSKPEEVH